MLNLIFVTLFPAYFREYFRISLPEKAVTKKIIEVTTYNIRDYALRGKADDHPYGGGSGMVIRIDALLKALSSAQEKKGELYIISLCPQGKIFQQSDVARLLKKKNLTFICGHYEGCDQRINSYIDEKISIGSFITMGGELPSLVIAEALIRGVPNFINPDSYLNESFTTTAFDHDSYTRPFSFDAQSVPSTLTGGNHREIEQ